MLGLTVLLLLLINVVASKTVDRANITLAGVVAAPPHGPLPLGNKDWSGIKLNLNDSISYAGQLILEAAGKGADLVAFPELWIPGYPYGYDLNNWVVNHIEDYIDNSLVIGSPEWNYLVNVTRSAGIYVGLAYSERIDDNIYMGQSLLGPDGALLLRRQKLRPSGSERDVFSDGVVEGLTAVNTSIGKISMLQCWEHLKHGMTFDVIAQLPNIHIGPWPYNQNPGSNNTLWWEDVSLAIGAQHMLSTMSGAVSLMPSVGYGAVFQSNAILNHSDSTKIATYGGKDGYSGLVYSSVNGSTWRNLSSNPNGEYSWDILGQMKEGYAKLLPTTPGTYVAHRNTSIASLLQYARSNGTTNLTSTPGPVVPSNQSGASSQAAAASAGVALSSRGAVAVLATMLVVALSATYAHI